MVGLVINCLEKSLLSAGLRLTVPNPEVGYLYKNVQCKELIIDVIDFLKILTSRRGIFNTFKKIPKFLINEGGKNNFLASFRSNKILIYSS